MPIIEYFLLALLGSTISPAAPNDPAARSLTTLGEDVVVQPTGALPGAGAFQKKPVKHNTKIVAKGNHRRRHHRRSGISNTGHIKPDAFTVKQKSQQK